MLLNSFSKSIMIGALLLLLASWGAGALIYAGETKNRDGNRFRNLYPFQRPGLWNLLKWRIERIGKNIPPPESYHFPMAENDPAFLQENRSQRTFTWIGHATALLQLDGVNILTDPMFSERASPVQWAGPRRVAAPGLALDDLPPIDAVLLSHNHYDSLDLYSVQKLASRVGGSETVFFVPLGLKQWFQDQGVENVIEMDWWAQKTYKDLRIHAVPAQHWSKRTAWEENETLWAGWVVEKGPFRFYFAGDTGYAPLFRDIGKRLGPFDLAAIPIGAYEPRWFMKNQHVNPEEALQIHLDVGARQSIAIHWGTFILTDEPLDEPPRRLAAAMEKSGVPPDAFRVLQHGETIVIETGK